MLYGHASMLLLGEGSEATEPYNKYANLFKYIKFIHIGCYSTHSMDLSFYILIGQKLSF